MIARLRSWWQKAKKPLEILIITVVCLLVIALVVVIILAYLFNVNVPGLRGKNLWDWLQLLIIPAVLAIGGYLFNYTTGRNEQKATQLRDHTERDISLDNQREQALQAYIDSMSELLLEKKLRESGENDEVRTIARVRTITVLLRLDKVRKAYLLQFLYESGLIHKDKKIIDLDGADLREADLFGLDLNEVDLTKAKLRRANLRKVGLNEAKLNKAFLFEAKLEGAVMIGTNMIGANLRKAELCKAVMMKAILINASLSEANLRETNLRGVNLRRADLTGADLTGADLTGADLTGAKVTDEQLAKAYSLEGATMPDGTIHA